MCSVREKRLLYSFQVSVRAVFVDMLSSLASLEGSKVVPR